MAVTAEDYKSSLEWIHKVKHTIDQKPMISTVNKMQFHAHGDSLDFEPFVYHFFTPDAELHFAGAPVLKGHDTIYQMFRTQKGLLDMMKHIVGHVDVVDDRIYQEAQILYRVKGDKTGEQIEVTGFAIYHKAPNEDRMHRFDVYGNFEKLQNRIKEVAEGQAQNS